MILFLYEFKNQCRLSNYSNFNRSYYMEIYILKNIKSVEMEYFRNCICQFSIDSIIY